MKILHIITVNGFGGAEKLLLHLLPALERQGIKVECLILNKSENTIAANSIKQTLQDKGIIVYSGSYKNLLDANNLAFIKKNINGGGYDLVHSHLKYTDTWLAFLKARGAIKVPVVSTLHGYNDDYEDSNGFVVKKSIYFTMYYWLTKYIWKNLDGFILISKIVEKFYKNIGMPVKEKNRMIYHGYEIERPLNKKNNFVINDNSRPAIAVPGRLLKRKGHLFAIGALQLLHKDYPGAALHFFGSGPFEENLKAIIKSKGIEGYVVFHGYVDDIIGYLEKCDIVVIPSMWEGFGIVFLDSFAAQRPVVAFDLPAGNEIIQHGQNGFLAKPGDAVSLAEMITELCKYPDVKNKMVETATAKLKNDFSIERMSKDYFHFYNSFL